MMRVAHNSVGRKLMEIWGVLASDPLSDAYYHFISRYTSRGAGKYTEFSDVMMAPDDVVREMVSKGDKDTFPGRGTTFCGDMHINGDVAYSVKSVVTAARLDGEHAYPVLLVEVWAYGQQEFDPKGLGIPMNRTMGVDIEYTNHLSPVC